MRKILVQLASNIPAALLGGGMFIVSLFLLQIGVGLSCLVALSSYVVGGTWLFPVDTASLPPTNALIKITRQEVVDAEYQVVMLKTLLLKIHELEIQHAARQICDAAQQIFNTINASADNAKTAQQFSVYALTPTVKIFKKYLEILSEPTANSAAPVMAARMPLIFESVRLAFNKQRDSMLREKRFLLDLEIAALAETLEEDRVNEKIKNS